MMTPSTPFLPFVPYAIPPLLAPIISPTMALARAGAAGDLEATHRLVVELAPRMGRVVRAILGGNHAELDDVRQQALFALVQALASFRGECEPAHFAARIAARIALTAARRARAARARCDDAVELDDLVSGAMPHDDLVRHRRTELLRELLTRIAPEQAETLTLRVVLGWSLPEVAAATGVPLNTVRSRIRLAKHALRAAIACDPTLSDELGAREGSTEGDDDSE